ncbi:MAG: class I adenylate-forming enzyme family protein [Pseudomonadota bacterium]
MTQSFEGKRWDEIVAVHAAQFPDRPALAYQDHVLDYAGFLAEVNACAEQLVRLGLGRGDRIALMSPARPEAMITFMAAARVGAVWLGLNPRYTPREISYVLGSAKPRLVISIESYEGRPYGDELTAALQAPGLEHCALVRFDAGRPDAEALQQALRDALPHTAAGTPPPATVEDDVCMLVYTSGTSGKPKGVLLRQRDLIFRSAMQSRTFSVSDYPRSINFAPINHIGGMHFRGLSHIIAAGTLVYQDRYRTSEIQHLMTKHRINVLMLGSTMLQMLLEEPGFDRETLRQAEWFIFSGAAMPMPLLRDLQQRCPRIGATYGLTESCGSVCYTLTPDSLEMMASSIGRPQPNGEARVAGPQGEALPPGQEGELQVRGEHCMAAYLDNEAATRAAFTPDGWLKTGDLAQMHDDGSIKLAGRMSEMYKSGGYNVYPREVELVLEEHPDVAMAAVIAVDDMRYQQVGHAFVIAKGGHEIDEAALDQWCRDRLANYKRPKRLFVRQSLPMLSIGKVDKNLLRTAASNPANTATA